MDNLMIFEGHKVEIFDFNGTVLFNPRHVGECLELTESAVRMSIAKMNEKQVIKLKNLDVKDTDIRKLNNAGENFLTESGVYKLIFKSKKEQAEKFQDWVTDEVLPAIRKNGGYLAGQETMSDEEIMAKALMVAQKTINNKNHIIEKQQKVIEELQPKASYYDLVLQCKDTIATTIIAKDYGLTTVRFNSMLKEFGIQYKQGETWLLYSKYQGYGYMVTKTHNFPDLDGVQHTRIHSYWTQKGRLFLYDFLKEKGILPMIERQEIA